MTKRGPIVVVMGHIDHGKSTLLDYIRKTNVVDGEAGGITQHLSAYEVNHKDESGENRRITFIDTPGHEAFSKMRERGADIGDIAILVVSAEDSVKAQTLEAYKTIKESGIPFIVAINKIDRPGANPEKTKMDLAENEIYLEGQGGDVPFVLISAKVGTGIDELLTMILLVADMHEFTMDTTLPAEGIVIEAHLDAKRGTTATLVLKNGTLKKGMWVVAGHAKVNTRIMENFQNKPVDELTPSAPVRLVGFDILPHVGSTFKAFDSKKEAEEAQQVGEANLAKYAMHEVYDAETVVIPIIIKTDVAGTGEAVEKEIKKLEQDQLKFKVIERGVGAIGENDIRLAGGDKQSIIIGFNVKVEGKARDLNEQYQIPIETFTIIYKISDFLKEIVDQRRPRKETLVVTGQVKIIRVFSQTKEKQVIGGKVVEGTVLADSPVRIMRRENEIGKAKILEIQHNKLKVKSIEAPLEFGMQIESKTEIAAGDILETFKVVTD
jgi:translation initiation factor IF-2